MAKDRHLTPGYIYRPQPSDLLKHIDEKVGTGRRAKAISLLLGRFLAGRPMPTVAEAIEELDKWGQDHSA
jgi:hypothetical protein